MQRAASRSELSELLWGGGRNLRLELHRLRQVLGAAGWLTVGDEVSLLSTSDLASFEHAVWVKDYQWALKIYRGEKTS